MNAHEKELDLSQPFSCPLCNEFMLHARDFHQHIREAKHKNWACVHCSQTFRSQSALARHWDQKLLKTKARWSCGRHLCEYCGQHEKLWDGKSSDHICNVMIENQLVTTILCDDCGEEFHKQKSLDCHRAAVHKQGQESNCRCGGNQR